MEGAMSRIPARLHYVWFGGKPLPPEMARTIDRWRALMPAFEVTEWNERNLDVEQHPWLARMHREQRWAFASDVARLLVLQRHGGIYLDTDMEVRRSLEPFLAQSSFWAFEFDTFLSTAIIGSRPGHPLLADLLRAYDTLDRPVVNNNLVTRHFIRAFPAFALDNSEQLLDGDVRVYPKEYFILPTWNRRMGYAVHRANNHWKGGRRGGVSPARLARAVLGEVLYFKLVNALLVRNDTFRAEARAIRGK
jgi:hypothetical protein